MGGCRRHCQRPVGLNCDGTSSRACESLCTESSLRRLCTSVLLPINSSAGMYRDEHDLFPGCMSAESAAGKLFLQLRYSDVGDLEISNILGGSAELMAAPGAIDGYRWSKACRSRLQLS
jgi:hypothetical protein